jgi:hypothetical protein
MHKLSCDIVFLFKYVRLKKLRIAAFSGVAHQKIKFVQCSTFSFVYDIFCSVNNFTELNKAMNVLFIRTFRCIVMLNIIMSTMSCQPQMSSVVAVFF